MPQRQPTRCCAFTARVWMMIGDHVQNRLVEHLGALATRVEAAIVAAADGNEGTCAGRLATIHEDLLSLSGEIHTEAISLMAGTRPVAGDLYLVSTALACCSDLQVAILATCGAASLLHGPENGRLTAAVPSLERLIALIGTLASLAADAVVERDAASLKEVHRNVCDVRRLRERVREEVAGHPPSVLESSLERLTAAETVATMLEFAAVAMTSCVGRMSCCPEHADGTTPLQR